MTASRPKKFFNVTAVASADFIRTETKFSTTTAAESADFVRTEKIFETVHDPENDSYRTSKLTEKIRKGKTDFMFFKRKTKSKRAYQSEGQSQNDGSSRVRRVLRTIRIEHKKLAFKTSSSRTFNDLT